MTDRSELDDLRAATTEHARLFHECKLAHTASSRALIAARNAGYSWEEIAQAAGRRSSLGPEVTAHLMRTHCIALWRTGNYGPIPDEALFKYEIKARTGKLQTDKTEVTQ